MRKPECNPHNMENDMTMEERLKISKEQFEGSLAQLAAMVTVGKRDQDNARQMANRANFNFDLFATCKNLVLALVGPTIGPSLLYQSLRPMFSKPGQAPSEACAAVLKKLGGDSHEAEENEFLERYPQYVPKTKGAKGGRVLVEAQIDVETVVEQQLTYYSAHCDEAVLGRLKAATESYLYQLRVMSTTGDKDNAYEAANHEIMALAYGLIGHVMNRKEGYFNGMDMSGQAECRAKLAEEDDKKARQAKEAMKLGTAPAKEG